MRQPMNGLSSATLRIASFLLPSIASELKKNSILSADRPRCSCSRASFLAVCRLPEAARTPEHHQGIVVAMASAQRGSTASGGAADGESRCGQEGRDEGGLACLLRGVARLLLGSLEVGEGLVDALLGVGLRQASLLHDELNQIGAIRRVELGIGKV